MENSFLEQYYNLYDEDGRLASKHGKVEFITTMKYIHDYVKPGAKVLEVGTGTGRYSITLSREGYQVQAEVKHCDIAAEKDGRLVVVELKRAFGLKLVYQGLERQSLTDEVFVAIPRPKKGAREKAWQDMLRLLKRLELGLLTVALDSPLKTVDVVLTPADSMIRKNKRKKEQLQAELEGRQLDANIGGMTRRKIITAYRERVIRLACILEREGEISLAELRARGLEELAVLLSRNYEKWFVRVEKGVYALSEKGKTELKRADYAKAAYYRQEQLGRNEETI